MCILHELYSTVTFNSFPAQQLELREKSYRNMYYQTDVDNELALIKKYSTQLFTVNLHCYNNKKRKRGIVEVQKKERKKKQKQKQVFFVFMDLLKNVYFKFYKSKSD